ncbi:beta-ketoacyl-ACP synthase III [Aliivibrio sp. S4TY2]|uniref:beta-ketoacyl-ACP synthase III n=1 Tax=unclassified Aliivibrio TaxID=2645654 RepID=UPI002378C3AB|nr:MULTISPECIES: beta-ketoacyl-ACP synthase III [unclassified Aliivibrio]MDD9154643.1 beta-ketoacyl-ACP synthase III [Aliivibrio sp. S4TY2]MDD9158994.1 beta-ketoacyl-ACP synthase III [Aliivibrio sp. S4TY1]MDD9162646.1 beta-ketoacyl-ACP synthase III [Aliivibrio sp. S4MY2]MDD9166993.1 beta-ketoacyl-ACP synthase III [Aliivibrio sp. S4MY4]MDD9183723.1 beta-ketoacyl-ACP synthase III [Aliivibrio sp. S4MY3]
MTQKVYINDIQAFLPNDAVGNKEIENVLGQVGSRPSRAKSLILRSNKIKQRYYAINPQTGETTHTNTELTAEAIRKLNSTSFDINSTELLACGTTIADQILPNHALMVHGELGIPSCEVIATSGICLSGTMSLKYGYMSILSGQSNNAIVTGSENASAMMRANKFEAEIESVVDDLERQPEIAFEKDFLRWMLSDGAGAALLTSQPNPDSISLEIEWMMQKSYANELDACMYAGAEKQADGSLKGWREYSSQEWLDQSIFSVKQDVKQLNDNIVEYTVTKPLKELVDQGKVKADEITYFVPHYSSGYFRDRLYQGMLEAGCDIPQDRWFTNLPSKGNTGSASIYIMLEELFHSGDLKVGDTLLCYVPESGRFSTAFMQLKVV